MRQVLYVNSLLTLSGCVLFDGSACEYRMSNSYSITGSLYHCSPSSKDMCYPNGFDGEEAVHHSLKTCRQMGYSEEDPLDIFEWVSIYGREYPSDEGAWGIGGGGSTIDDGGGACSDYVGPTSDPQRDPQCQAAWSAECAGQDPTPYCDIYNSTSWGSAGSCPYC